MAARNAIDTVLNKLTSIQTGQIFKEDAKSNAPPPKVKMIQGPRYEYFRLGRDTTAIDDYDVGDSGSEFPVQFK